MEAKTDCIHYMSGSQKGKNSRKWERCKSLKKTYCAMGEKCNWYKSSSEEAEVKTSA